MPLNRPIDKFNPKYYRLNALESIEIIEAFNLTFSLGNALKYLLRCNKVAPKGDINSDLNKAIWYIERELENTQYIKTKSALNFDEVINKEIYSLNILDAIEALFNYFSSKEKTKLQLALTCIKRELNEF